MLHTQLEKHKLEGSVFSGRQMTMMILWWSNSVFILCYVIGHPSLQFFFFIIVAQFEMKKNVLFIFHDT